MSEPREQNKRRRIPMLPPRVKPLEPHVKILGSRPEKSRKPDGDDEPSAYEDPDVLI